MWGDRAGQKSPELSCRVFQHFMIQESLESLATESQYDSENIPVNVRSCSTSHYTASHNVIKTNDIFPAALWSKCRKITFSVLLFLLNFG